MSAYVCRRCGNPVRPAFGGTWTHRPIPGAAPRDYRHRIVADPAPRAINSILVAVRANDFAHDPYGAAMMAWFEVADYLSATGQPVPPEWDYRPSPLLSLQPFRTHPAVSGSDYAALVYAGTVLMRYAALLRLAGRDY